MFRIFVEIFWISAFVLWTSPDCALARKTYSIQQVSTGAFDHKWQALNNRGDLIWSQQVNGHWQVFKNGAAIPIPDPAHNFQFPHISEAGDIVYLKDGADGGIGLQVILNQASAESIAESSSCDPLSGAHRDAAQHFGISGNGTITSPDAFCDFTAFVRRFDVSTVGHLSGDSRARTSHQETWGWPSLRKEINEVPQTCEKHFATPSSMCFCLRPRRLKDRAAIAFVTNNAGDSITISRHVDNHRPE